MKFRMIFCSIIVIAALVLMGNSAYGLIFINEVDYDQPGIDTAEFIELSGTSGSYSGYSLQLINGSGGGAVVYQTIALPDFILSNESDGYGFFVISANALTVPNTDLDVSPDSNLIQNGAPDGIQLLMGGTVIQYLSYEGDSGILGITVNDGGVDVEDSGDGSIQKTGIGSDFGDFGWAFGPATPGMVNDNQQFQSAQTVPEPSAAMLMFFGCTIFFLMRRIIIISK